MKWFFCLDDNKPTFDLAKVAVVSCLRKTSLTPVCLYCGGDQSQIDWFVSKGVQVIQHKAPVLEEIETYHAKEIGWRAMYMRMDIPLLCPDERCLYTDVDVQFVGDCEGLKDINPKFLGACAQEDPNNFDFFNNGVMYLSGAGMRRSYKKFLAYTKSRLRETRFFDQSAYNEMYGRDFTRLPPEYNWKSYWPDHTAGFGTFGLMERSMPIQIIHYHGPKPWNVYGDHSWWCQWPKAYFTEDHKRRAQEWHDYLAEIG